MAVTRLSISDALNITNSIFIDVRTSLEFEEGSIPGAINVPILSNEERVEIGTLYKQKGAEVARERGLDIISPKLPTLFLRIKTAAFEKMPILYCARGGLRSQTVATVLDLTGLKVCVVEGGYKNYRQEVLNVLNSPYPFKLITLYGFTGSGKTHLLNKMKEKGLPVIDLEALAHHRGSVFGQVGIIPKQTQKNFEALLYQEIKKYKESPQIFIEGESKRIGPVVLPQLWMEHMEKGSKILIRSSLEKRTERILKEYLGEGDKNLVPELEKALFSIEKRLGGELFKKIHTLFQQEDYKGATCLLLEHYYDQNYKFSSMAPEEAFSHTFENNSHGDEERITLEMRRLTVSFKTR
ncbi:MAG: tRNA 2-selenouridine(34) synthase MnmH [Deltaproteobacteria bacterium GWA2_38_16]|nr:MAG: tRNA 2-selenouridine(34) synthase MnmH [Deltaproteobacteria bacterium GWA2_38_16]OGQ02665.1 MAG: tRNA 2-selenouridine(34) synthase MnmH [Deltaproteobacteria bacterium RIFCSPHIGHO2_02_FULL_38_15]OGQ59647.1 MAG: tRNA 2-selenouridine(34) synthase MnmH [Deltaproteobacteria bacterium RIFCSPLOWO2_12_FULL_38_8]HBQ21653.1 tRNA 2-selenouridine(34) synthase MnmH [Deltaproteobacteria bacterium]